MIQCRNKSLQSWCVLWFWPLLSDGIVWWSYLAGSASYLYILLSCDTLDQDTSICQRAVLQTCSGALCSMISHVQEWDGSRKIMPGKQGKARERRSWGHSGYWTSELDLYRITQVRTNCSPQAQSFLSNRGCHDQWTSMSPPVGSHDATACMAIPTINPPLHQLLCCWLRQGWSVKSYCKTAFPYPVVRLQEFVLIPGIVKFDFVYAAVNPCSFPEDCSYRAQNETIITLPFRAGLPTQLFPIRSARIIGISEY